MIFVCGEEILLLIIDSHDLISELVPLPEEEAIVGMGIAIRRGMMDIVYNSNNRPLTVLVITIYIGECSRDFILAIRMFPLW